MSDWELDTSAPAAPAGGGGSDWVVDEPTAAAQPEGRSFLRRAIDTVKSGATDVGHVLREGLTDVERGVGRALGAKPEELSGHEVTGEERAARRHEFERGVDKMVTLGFGQKLARAAEETSLGRAANAALGQAPSMSAEQEARDQQLAPGYRTAGQLAGTFMPGAASAISKAPGLALRAAGKMLPGAAETVVRVGAAATDKAARVPFIGRFLAPAVAGAGGAARGVAEYETTAPLISAASADAAGHREEAAHEAATDPLGLLTSAVGGAVPAGAKEATRQARSYVEAAPAAADAWIVNDIRGQRAGDSSPTARKYLAADEADVQALVKSDPELRETLADARHGDKAKLQKASAAVGQKIEEVNAPRTEAYDRHVDGALGGGIRAGDFIDDLRAKAEELKAGGTAGGHKMAKYLEARADELEQSRAWGAEQRTEVDSRELSKLEQMRANASVKNPAAARALDAQIATLKSQGRETSAHNPDAIVPTRTARAVVSDIQNAAYDGLGGLADTRAAGQARHVAGIVKDVFDKYLDKAAEQSPEAAQAVEQIRNINTQHSALKNIQRVIDERLNKATQGAHGAGVPMAGRQLVRHFAHSNAGLLAAERLYHGHPLEAAAIAGIAAAPALKRALDTRLAGNQAGYLAAVDRLARAARASRSASEFVREAVSAGLGVDAARKIYERAHPGEAMPPANAGPDAQQPPVSTASTSADDRKLLSTIGQKYKALAPFINNAEVIQSPDPGDGRQLEFYHPASEENPAKGKLGFELFKPLAGREREDAIAADALHYLGGLKDDDSGAPIDPHWMSLKRELWAARSPAQVAIDRRAFNEEHEPGQSMDAWVQRNRADAYVRGGLFPDRNPEWNRPGDPAGWTPRQRKILQEMKAYLQSGQAGRSK